MRSSYFIMLLSFRRLESGRGGKPDGKTKGSPLSKCLQTPFDYFKILVSLLCKGNLVVIQTSHFALLEEPA